MYPKNYMTTYVYWYTTSSPPPPMAFLHNMWNAMLYNASLLFTIMNCKSEFFDIDG